MQKHWFKHLAVLSTIILLLSTILPTFSFATESFSLDDGEYTVDFTILKDGTEETSVMDGYTEKPATLFVEDGSFYVHLTLTSSSWIQSFQVKQGEVFVEAEEISQDEDANKRVVGFPVADLESKTDIFTHVVITGIPGFEYDNEYTVQLQFDVGSIEAVEGSEQPIEPEPEQPVQPTEPEALVLEDGEYTVDFTILKDGTEEASVMDGYTEKPATLFVEDGSFYVHLTLTSSSWIQSFQVKQGGEFVEAEEISRDEEANKRVVGFPVADLESKTDIFTHVVITSIPGFEYDNQYTVQLQFDIESIAVVGGPGQPTDPEEPEQPTEPEAPVLENGQYTIDFVILKDGTDETSVMDGYTEKPATLFVENGSFYVHLTLTSSSWIKSFQFKQDGEFVEAEEVSSDEGANKKVVGFPVADLESKTDIFTHVVITGIPGFEYDNEYIVQLQFDLESLINDSEEETEELVVELGENGTATFNALQSPTLITTSYQGLPFSLLAPAGSNSLSVTQFSQSSSEIILGLSVGNLGSQAVTLKLPKPSGLSASQVGVFQRNGSVWEYVAGKIEGDQVVFETNLSGALKIGQKVGQPTQLSSNASRNKVTLNWSAVSGARYEIVRISGNTEVAIPNLATSYYTDTVDYNGSYVYKVRAIQNQHYSDWSNEISVRTGSFVPQRPQDLADGEYSIQYRVLKDGTNQTSIMQDYTVTPAKLIVENGRTFLSITLKNSSWIKVFSITGNGSAARVESTDTAADTRVVSFEVNDLTQKVHAYTEVDVPALNYSGKYNVQFEFDVSSVREGYAPGTVTSNPLTTAETFVSTIRAKDGGKVEYRGATIDIPKDAFDRDIKITVQTILNPSTLPLKQNMKIVSDVLEITKDRSGNFTKAITISIPFNVSLVDFANYDLSIFWLNERTGEWIPLDNVQVNRQKAIVSGEVDHFTKFAVLAVEKDKASVSLTDIKGHWAEEAIQALVELGAINGYANGEFRPNRQITRAEFATILVKAFQLEAQTGKEFKDTVNHHAREAISIAAALGIVQGYDEHTFGVNDAITREQMTLMLVRATQLQPNSRALTFSDADRIAPWAVSAVQTAFANGLISGYPYNKFMPKGHTTRAEAATVIIKALQYAK